MTRGTFLLTTVLAAGSTLWSGQPVIKIDSDRQLFVDELLIARQQGVTLQLHSPIPREVALAMEEPWEQEDLSSPVVMKDGSRYRMWYSVWHSIVKLFGCRQKAKEQEDQGDPMGRRSVPWVCAGQAMFGRESDTPGTLKARTAFIGTGPFSASMILWDRETTIWSGQVPAITYRF